jgi:hypothetical protein
MSVGVVLLTLASGGVAGAFLTNLLTRRREQRANEAEALAARWLVTLELVNAQAGVQFILGGDWYTRFPTDAWEHERSRLARGLPMEAYLVLSAAYNTIHGYNWRFDSSVFQSEASDPDSAWLHRSCARIEVSATAALAVLEDLRA